MHNDSYSNSKTSHGSWTVVRRERRFTFDHHSLDAYHVALEAMVRGKNILNNLPQGNAKLKDHGERAFDSAFTNTAEGSAHSGAERLKHFRIARAEAGESAAVLEGLAALGAADESEVDRVLELLSRLCAMLTRLAKIRRR